MLAGMTDYVSVVDEELSVIPGLTRNPERIIANIAIIASESLSCLSCLSLLIAFAFICLIRLIRYESPTR